MRKRTATACYRELGAELSKRREAAGRSRMALARDFGCAPSHISRIESGHAPVSEVDVIHYLGLCGVFLKDAHELLEMCRLAKRNMGYWLSGQGELLDDSIRALIFHESTAISSVTFEPQKVPGLLQTEHYARAMIGLENWRTAENIEFCVQARLERQRILHRSQSGRFTFFVHEDALRPVASSATMHEQLLALTLLDGLPHVDVRVVLSSAVFGGAFRLLEFAGQRPLVYLDAYIGGLFVEDREYVDGYRRVVSAIADVALDGRQSREFLATRANEYDRERADLDVHEHVAEKQL